MNFSSVPCPLFSNLSCMSSPLSLMSFVSRWIPTAFVLLHLILAPIGFLLFSNVINNSKNLAQMARNEKDFRAIDIYKFETLRETVERLPEGYGVVLLNQYALNMTLNWACNVKEMNVLHKILFFVLDDYAKEGLLSNYPTANVVVWNAPSIQKSFRPYDSTYMSFFLMRTNLIVALQAFEKGFWMLQADTTWTDSLLDSVDIRQAGDILLDQQGHEGTAESRKRIMNGANFFVPTRKTSKDLVARWLDWQKWIYITDPDLVKMFCIRGDYDCNYLPHKIVSGWEWIYGTQTNPPIAIQMDGETGGNKETVLAKYGFWFLDERLQCNQRKVKKAIESVRQSKVPRVISSSKEREAIVLKIGELMNQMPVFGHFSSIYGGLASLYLQIF